MVELPQCPCPRSRSGSPLRTTVREIGQYRRVERRRRSARSGTMQALLGRSITSVVPGPRDVDGPVEGHRTPPIPEAGCCYTARKSALAPRAAMSMASSGKLESVRDHDSERKTPMVNDPASVPGAVRGSPDRRMALAVEPTLSRPGTRRRLCIAFRCRRFGEPHDSGHRFTGGRGEQLFQLTAFDIDCDIGRACALQALRSRLPANTVIFRLRSLSERSTPKLASDKSRALLAF